MRPDAVGGAEAAVQTEMIPGTFLLQLHPMDDATSQKSCRLVGPDLCGSVFEGIHMNHPPTSLRNESPARLLTF